MISTSICILQMIGVERFATTIHESYNRCALRDKTVQTLLWVTTRDYDGSPLGMTLSLEPRPKP